MANTYRPDYIEDLLVMLDLARFDDNFRKVLPDPWYEKFISNVSGHVARDKPLSTEQARIVLRVCDRARSLLLASDIDPDTLDDLLQRPVYRRTPYPSSNVPREVRWVGDDKLAFRFKRNDVTVEALKKLVKRHNMVDVPRFDRTLNAWIVAVNRHSFDSIFDIIGHHRFSYDEGVEAFLAACEEARGGVSEAIIENDEIQVRVRDDDFLGTWLIGIEDGTPK